MTREEMINILSKPKSVSYANEYRQIYYQLTGKQIGGCLGCRLTWLYQTLKKLV